jgi:hypothetical protein
MRTRALLASWVLLLPLVWATPARALPVTAVTVDAVTAPDLVVTGTGCKAVPVSVAYTATNAPAEWDGVTFAADVRQGTRDVWVTRAPRSTQLPATGAYYWCPVDGLGTFEVLNLTGDFLGWTQEVDPVQGRFASLLTATFTVRAGSRVSGVDVRRVGHRVAVSGRLSSYETSTGSWRAMDAGTPVVLQRRSAHGSWTDVRRVAAGTGGRLRTTVCAGHSERYRWVYAGSGVVAPTRSRAAAG